jgi:hypothetical protein
MQNCVAEGNHVMRQENEHVSCQFHYTYNNFTPSGCGRARAIVNAASHAWNCQATHLEGTTHTWGNCFQNPHTQGGRASGMAGRHNGRGHSSFGEHGHFGGRGGGSPINPMESYHTDTTNPVPVQLTRMYTTI